MIDNPTLPDERITIQAGADKYALVFTNVAIAAVFMADLQDPTLRLESLDSWVLKETYLTTCALLGASRVVFDYQRGQHHAVSAPLEGLRLYCAEQIGGLPH